MEGFRRKSVRRVKTLPYQANVQAGSHEKWLKVPFSKKNLRLETPSRSLAGLRPDTEQSVRCAVKPLSVVVSLRHIERGDTEMSLFDHLFKSRECIWMLSHAAIL